MRRIELNAGWQFCKLPDGICPITTDPSWETVSLPHTWYSDDDQYHGLAVYRKEVPVDADFRKAFLEFEGADQVCRVYADGEQIGEHKGGYSRFRIPVPAKAVKCGSMSLEVYLDNRITPEVSPNFGDFTVFGGLYRGVNLLVSGEDHFDYCYYGTDGVIARTKVTEDGKGILDLEPHVCTGDPAAEIRYTLIGPDGKCAGSCTGPAAETAAIEVAEPVLWNGKKAAVLYTLRAALMVNGEAADETTVRVGFRSVTISPDDGLRLNGERIRIKGVAKHQDRAGMFCAVKDEQIDEDFALIREIGANAVRLSHYQHAQHTYDLCDEEGLMTWAEIPMLKMTENQALFQNAEEQLRELILQNIHHPAIYCWGIQNEIAMFRDAPYMHEECRRLAALVKELDPDRLTTAANLYSVKFTSELNKITDMVGYNLYFGWYYGEMQDYSKYLDGLHEACPQTPFGISEYGVDSNIALHAEDPQIKDYSEEYQALWHETVYPILRSKDYLWGTYVWNMFDFSSDRRDEGGVKFINGKGLVNFDRSIRKDAFYYYRAVWSDDPFVHICSRRFVKRCRESIDVKVYTNQPSVTLWVGGTEWGTRPNNGNGTVVFSGVALEPGKNSVVVRAGAYSDECKFERVETEESSYRLPDSGGGAVRNWFLSDDDTVKEGYYSIMDTADDLLQCVDARAVLTKYVPQLVKLMDQDVIPLGFSIKNILGRDLKDDPDTMTKINDELHEIKKQF